MSRNLFFSKLTKKLKLNKLAYKISDVFVSDKKLVMDNEKYLELLNECHPEKETSIIRNNNIHDFEYDLQIIVPVYNVERYLKQCLDSIANQKTEYTYICYVIDDGSTDGSSLVVDEYKDNPLFKIIHQENAGLSGARNTGLKDIYGRYLMFVDSDDYLSDEAVEKLLDEAYDKNADIVEGSYTSFDGDRQFSFKNSAGPCDRDALSGYAWLKIVKAELFKNLIFPEGYWFEDTLMSFMVYPLAERIYRISDVIYYHRINLEGIVSSASGNKRSLETLWISKLLNDERMKLSYPCDIDYWNLLRKQFLMNYRRTYFFDENVKKAIFTFESNLLKKCFDTKMNDDRFMNYIYEGNYDKYDNYAYWNN